MTLKFKLESLEGLDENLAKLYVKHDDGFFYLNVDGAVSKSKLDEFRDNNIQLMKDLEKYKDVDPEKYAELLKKAQENDGKKMVELSKLNDMVEERVATMREEYEKQIGDLTDQLGKSNSQLDVLLIDSAIRTESIKNGIIPSAVDDVVLRAKSVFKVKEGKAVPFDSEGKEIYSKNGEDTMPPGEWVKGLIKTAPHLFIESAGGGSFNNGGGGHKDRDKMSAREKISAGLEAHS